MKKTLYIIFISLFISTIAFSYSHNGIKEVKAESNADEISNAPCSFWGSSSSLSCEGNNCVVCTSSGIKTYCFKFDANKCSQEASEEK